MATSFEITKHYEVFSNDEEKSFKIREVEVVVRDGKAFKWSGATGQLFLLPCKHLKTAREAYDDWVDRITQQVNSYKRAVGVLEAKLSIPAESFEIVREQQT